jgi:hypothetical protein
VEHHRVLTPLADSPDLPSRNDAKWPHDIRGYMVNSERLHRASVTLEPALQRKLEAVVVR